MKSVVDWYTVSFAKKRSTNAARAITGGIVIVRIVFAIICFIEITREQNYLVSTFSTSILRDFVFLLQE